MATKVGCGAGMVWQAVGDGRRSSMWRKVVEGHCCKSGPHANVGCCGANRKLGDYALFRGAMEFGTYFCPFISKVNIL